VPLGPMVFAGPIIWAMEDAPEVLRFYRDWVADAPDELMTIVIHRKAPPLPFVPDELYGKRIVMVICCWAGDIEEGEKAVRPLREFGNPIADACTAMPFVALQEMFDPSFVPGRWYYIRSCDVPALTDEVIDTTVEHSLQISSPLTAFPIWQMGGAVARVREDETAFNGRNAGFTYNIAASTATAEGFDEERDWVRNFWSALEPHFTGVYVNFLMEEGEGRVRQAYGPEKYARLQALKRKYDPENAFRLNQNVPPA
jgi:Berberine and berberine like